MTLAYDFKTTDRERRARQLVDLLLEEDDHLRELLAGHPMKAITAGSASVVFTFGPDRVIKVISPGPWPLRSTELDDCDVAATLWEAGGNVVGWPKVYDFAQINPDDTYAMGWDDPVCVVVVEKVWPGDDLSKSDRDRLGRVVTRLDRIHALGFMDEPFRTRHEQQIDLDESLDPFDDEQNRWLKQFVEGLTAIDRWEQQDSLDFWSFSNVGLTRDREAVFVDFGI